jgi:predicted peptidase
MRFPFYLLILSLLLSCKTPAPLAIVTDLAESGISKAEAKAMKQLITTEYQHELARKKTKEWKNLELSFGEYTMPFTYKKIGKEPDDGYPLYISMHGGGGTTAAVNDQQYKNQQRLYDATMKDMAGIYLTPRAPTNSWNLWHQSHIDELFNQLIQLAIIKENIDPNRVYLLGYSAGGDGVYQLAPRMADRFAAAAMMAGHPNDASPLSLRNLPFALQVGAEDASYNRNTVAAAWGQQLDALQKSDADGYKHLVKIHAKKGHWMDLEDAIALPWMAEHRRNPIPEKLVWMQGGTAHQQFYWLGMPDSLSSRRRAILAEYKRESNTVYITDNYAAVLYVYLDDRMLDLDKEVTLISDGRQIFKGMVYRKPEYIRATLANKGDPNLAFYARLTIKTTQTVSTE